jgi:hypothetical protein
MFLRLNNKMNFYQGKHNVCIAVGTRRISSQISVYVVSKFTFEVFRLFNSVRFSDPSEDMFAKRMKARKENAAKNELQRLRNIARHMKGKGRVFTRQLKSLLCLCRSLASFHIRTVESSASLDLLLPVRMTRFLEIN